MLRRAADAISSNLPDSLEEELVGLVDFVAAEAEVGGGQALGRAIWCAVLEFHS